MITTSRRIAAKLIFTLILGINLGTGIIGILLTPARMAAVSQIAGNFTDFGEEPEIATQQMVIVYPPAIHFFYNLSIRRLFDGQPMPPHIRVLSPGIVDVTLVRTDANSLHIKPAGGYYPPPQPLEMLKETPGYHINLVYSLIRLERITVDDSYTPQVGNTIRLTGVTIEITGLTKDGRIGEVLFTFSKPLEAPDYCFLYWDWKKQKYIPFMLPNIGEEVRFNSKGSPVTP